MLHCSIRWPYQNLCSLKQSMQMFENKFSKHGICVFFPLNKRFEYTASSTGTSTRRRSLPSDSRQKGSTWPVLLIVRHDKHIEIMMENRSA